MAYEVFDGTDMLGQLFGEGQRITHQPRDSLAERMIETLNVIGVARLLCDGFVLRCLSMAIQTYYWLAFCFTKLHISSASTSRRPLITSRGNVTGCTYG
jgi:hypothetical protein